MLGFGIFHGIIFFKLVIMRNSDNIKFPTPIYYVMLRAVRSFSCYDFHDSKLHCKILENIFCYL